MPRMSDFSAEPRRARGLVELLPDVRVADRRLRPPRRGEDPLAGRRRALPRLEDLEEPGDDGDLAALASVFTSPTVPATTPRSTRIEPPSQNLNGAHSVRHLMQREENREPPPAWRANK